MVDEIAFISRIPKLRSRSWLVLEPFSHLLWFTMIIVFIIVSYILYFISKWEINHNYNHKNISLSYRSIWLKLLAIIVNQHAHVVMKTTLKQRMILIGWIVGNMVLVIAYSTEYYTFLALPQYDDPLLTKNDLIKVTQKMDHYLFTLDGSIVMNLKNIESDDFKIIGANLAQNERFNVAQLEEGFDRIVQDSRFILIESRAAFKFLLKTYAQKAMLISNDILANDFLTVGFTRRSPIFDSFNSIISACSYFGFKQHWLNKLIILSETANIEEYSISSIQALTTKTTLAIDGLQINDLGSIFIIWSIGLSYSFLIFLLEIVMKFTTKSPGILDKMFE
uniref:Uncharacterized protein LOC113794967 n=1 Tax=Dermatophagoides pteronyssinus TaxID=6956 RepID=A0A6P6Y6L9_DERPT|nr:uncharacterized protein LOC113794967 [Dermatophagoides pteronyssinus]